MLPPPRVTLASSSTLSRTGGRLHYTTVKSPLSLSLLAPPKFSSCRLAPLILGAKSGVLLTRDVQNCPI
jgi:hypothetical protein